MVKDAALSELTDSDRRMARSGANDRGSAARGGGTGRPDPPWRTGARQPAELRETLRARLRMAADMVGSVAETAAVIGVNRTQFSRYLAGQSMPRPDLLYRLSRRLDLPMEWFFDAGAAPADTLVEHQLGVALRRRVSGARMRLTEADLPDGFYAVWKRSFMAALPYQMLLGVVTGRHGTKRLRCSTRWRHNVPTGRFSLHRDYLALDFLVLRSMGGLFLLSINGAENRIVSMFLRQTAPLWGARFRTQFSGIGVHGVFGPAGNSVVVPVLMSHLEPGDPGAVLKTARRVGGYRAEEMPVPVRRTLDALRVPEFQMLI